MRSLTFGDLASTFASTRFNANLKITVQTLSQELATGERADRGTAKTGDLRPIAALAAAQQTNQAYATVVVEAAQMATAMQAAFDVVGDHATELATALLTAASSENAVMIDTTAADAKNKFSAVLSALNTRTADRYSFSGTTLNSPALADMSAIVTSLQTAIAADMTAADVVATVDSWFDTAGGGFETVAYLGGSAATSGIKLSENDQVDLAVTAADPKVREVLKGFALASLVHNGTLNGDISERAKLSRHAGEKLLSSQTDMSALRARLGTAEAYIEDVTVKNAAQSTALELARSELVAAEPYETAAALQSAQTQLETLYALTARLSRLSLADYLS